MGGARPSATWYLGHSPFTFTFRRRAPCSAEVSSVSQPKFMHEHGFMPRDMGYGDLTYPRRMFLSTEEYKL